MSDDMSTPPSIHMYKQKPGILLLNLIYLIILMIMSGVLLTVIVSSVVLLSRMEQGLHSTAYIPAIFLSPVMILAAFSLILLIISLFMSFFSFIKISPEGIEQKNSIYMHIRCKWSDVDRIGRPFFFSDAIYLNSFEVIGTSISLKPVRLLWSKNGFIPLTGYVGWPNGQLAADLKQYAPELFDNQPVLAPAAQPDGKEVQVEAQVTETRSISQTERIWAAIAHASVLFFPLGVVVPLGVYLSQRKISSYLGFQSLQAFIWQIILNVFSFMVYSCMVVTLIVYNFQANMSNFENPGSVSDRLGIVSIMITMVFSTLYAPPAIYGIVGAVKSYQGDDFRYFIIGNLIGKSKRFHRFNRT